MIDELLVRSNNGVLRKGAKIIGPLAPTLTVICDEKHPEMENGQVEIGERQLV